MTPNIVGFKDPVDELITVRFDDQIEALDAAMEMLEHIAPRRKWWAAEVENVREYVPEATTLRYELRDVMPPPFIEGSIRSPNTAGTIILYERILVGYDVTGYPVLKFSFPAEKVI